MKNWTESKAISVLTSNGAEVRGKTIIAKSGLRGLTACSAFDFLRNHCGYISNL